MHGLRKWIAAGAAALVVALAAVLLIAGHHDKPHGSGGFAVKPGHPGRGGGNGVSAGGVNQLQGAQLHPLWWDSTTADFDRELDLLKDAGADVVRIDLSWSSLETDAKDNHPSWYVTKADTFLQHAQDRGIAVIATLWSTPCWASSAPDSLKQSCAGAWWDRGVDRYPPTNASDYADAAVWVASRWSSKLRALEIWNEPNLPDKYSLQAADPAAADAAMLKAAYPRIKQAAPNLTVLAGALAFSDGDFLEKLYDAGIAGNFDGFSIHPYNEWRAPDDPWQLEWRKYTYLTGVPWIQSILTAHGDGAKGLWLTELGWSTCGTGSSWCVTPDQQAQYVGNSLRISAGWSYVKAAVIYNLRNKGTDPQGREDQFGIVQRDFTLKPAYASFKEALTSGAPVETDTGTTTTPADTGTTTTPAVVPDRPSVPDVKLPPVQVPSIPLPFVVTVPDVRPILAAEPTRSSSGETPSQPASPTPSGKVVKVVKAVAVKLRCRPAAARTCRGTVELRSTKGVLLAKATFNIKRGPRTVTARLTRAGRKQIKKNGKTKFIATVRAKTGLKILRTRVS